MTIKQIQKYLSQFQPGDIISVNNPATSDRALEDAYIKEIHPKYAVVTNLKYNWCVDWVEIMKSNFKER